MFHKHFLFLFVLVSHFLHTRQDFPVFTPLYNYLIDIFSFRPSVLKWLNFSSGIPNIAVFHKITLTIIITVKVIVTCFKHDLMIQKLWYHYLYNFVFLFTWDNVFHSLKFIPVFTY